jgi:electron transfer flavoprotein beta subunit
MKITVCVKQIPDPNEPYALEDGRLKRDGVTPVMDPGDEFGVEEALKVAEQSEGSEVTVVSMGPEQAVEALRRALSMGADKGVLVSDDKLSGADALVTARVLAEAIKRTEPDLVIAGVESTDGYTGVVPGMIAEFLGFPMCTVTRKLELTDGGIKVERQTEKGYDVVEAPLPALITVTAAINEPRYPSFKGIMKAKQKPLDQLTVADLGLSDDDVKRSQSVAAANAAPERKAGEVIEDEGDAGAKIADFLKERKVI